MNENAGLHSPASFNRIRKTGADKAVGYHEKEKEMGIINEIHQQTKNRFLNMYEQIFCCLTRGEAGRPYVRHARE